MRGRDLFVKYKWVLKLIAKWYSIFPRRYRLAIYEKHMSKRGKIGVALRYAVLSTLLRKIGDNVMIGTNVYIYNVQNIEIGDNVSIHPMSYIEGYGGVSIGDDVSIATGAVIMSVNHGYGDLVVPIKEQPLEKRPINICENVWIGAKSTILGNVTIKKGAIVGAGAVVSKVVEENSIVVGVPATVLKVR